MDKSEITTILEELSSPLDLSGDSVGIILAAGHGKRIKSEKSKMLHEIWGVPTVMRVSRALTGGLGVSAQIVVVGIKAAEVARAVGKKENLAFVYQAEQKGTGDAVRTAMQLLNGVGYKGEVYVVPGDMGLLDMDTMRSFRDSFRSSEADMMVLTGIYDGDPVNNQYGRIIRAPSSDVAGETSGVRGREVIEIREHGDILAMNDDTAYEIAYKDRRYSYKREKLLSLTEFNTGIFGFKSESLASHLGDLTTDNVQGELYVTDLIGIFNKCGERVEAAEAEDSRLVEGFNVKSVLHGMEAIERARVYNILKDIITIEDEFDFFIADEVVDRILKLDEEGSAGDIFIGKGAHVGVGLHLSDSVRIGVGARLEGTVELGEKVSIGERVSTSSYDGQKIVVGRETEILNGNEIKGEVSIGEKCRIEQRVSITGSSTHPVRIGDDVWIRGETYIFGSIIEDGAAMSHCIFKKKRVRKFVGADGNVRKIRYVIPRAEGIDAISDLDG